MSKFKKFLISFILYNILVIFYLYNDSGENISISILYNNIIFFFINVLIYTINLENDSLIIFKINRYNNLNNYFKNFMIKNILINLCTSIGLFLSNILVFGILKYNINYVIAIKYTCLLFLIFAIYSIFILCGTLIKKLMETRLIMILYLIFSFLLYNVGIIDELSINILKYYFYDASISNILLHYLIWIYGGYLLFDFIKKRIEI